MRVFGALSDWDGHRKTARETNKETKREKKKNESSQKKRALPLAYICLFAVAVAIKHGALYLTALNSLPVTVLLSVGTILTYHRL